MRVIHAGKRPLERDGDTGMVCGMDVCDELDETHFSDTYVNDCEGDYTDEVTRVQSTHGRDEWYEKFNLFEEVTDETCVSRTGRKPISCRWRDINKGDNESVEVRSRLVAREINQKMY